MELDQETITRIKDCKLHGFPICLEVALSFIFKESAGEAILEKVIGKLGLREQDVDSAAQVWETYDAVLKELTKMLGQDVSRIVEFQSLREMESMSGCVNCPLHRRVVCRFNAEH